MKLFSLKIVYTLLIIKIISENDCFKNCQTCSNSNECDTCINGTYKLVETNNCYYQFELPKCYLNPSLQLFNYCSPLCYECSDNENNCISCPRRYILNGNE